MKEEYGRIKGDSKGLDEKQMELLDGAFWECARLRVELDSLHEIVKKSGLVKTNPANISQQKEMPVSKMIVRVRANYLNYMAKLSSILGKQAGVGEPARDEDGGLDEFE